VKSRPQPQPRCHRSAGLSGGTIIPDGKGVRVEIIDTDSPTLEKIGTIGSKLGATEIEVKHGNAEFIGKDKYDSIIRDYQRNPIQKHNGRGSGYDDPTMEGANPKNFSAILKAWQISKFDPNHDELGRFSTASGDTHAEEHHTDGASRPARDGL
jgi:hypothetical protein